MMLPDHYPQFFTATILEWKHLLKPKKYKELIASSLHFLIQDKRVVVYGFVFMSNHIHLVWQIQPGHKREDVQRDFLKYTAQKMKQDLENNHPQVLVIFLVNAKDRKYQVWERNPLSVDLWSREAIWQKLEYIHQNPVRAGLCITAKDYYWSSAMFYHTGKDNFGWLTHVMD